MNKLTFDVCINYESEEIIDRNDVYKKLQELLEENGFEILYTRMIFNGDV
jgi:hypothetical protein